MAVALGDSITNGYGYPTPRLEVRSWAEWVAKALGLPILNLAANNGPLERIAAKQLPELPEHSCLTMTLLGANDVAAPERFTYEAVDGFLGTLSAMSGTLLVATIPAGLRQLDHWPDARIRTAIRSLNEITRKAAASAGAILVELEDAFVDRHEQLGTDALHLDALGQLHVAELALKALGWPIVRPLPEPSPDARQRRALLVPGRARLLVRRVTGASLRG